MDYASALFFAYAGAIPVCVVMICLFLLACYELGKYLHKVSKSRKSK